MKKKRGAIRVESGKPRENLRDGYSDGFVPLKLIDLSKIKSFSDMTSAMSFTALGARGVGEATDLLYEMATNKNCFVEEVGMQHFKYKFGEMDDKKLYYGGYDRIYDTLELESNMDKTEDIIKHVLSKADSSKPICSHELLNMLGKYLHDHTKGRGILKSAYEKNVPVYIPAFTDSEMALDFAIFIDNSGN